MSKNRNYLKLRDPADSLKFGRLTAENDENLAQYYVADEMYVDRALKMNDAAVFFIGPKGIGKSAILQMVRLRRSTESNRIIDITPDDLAFSALANVEANSPILSDAGKNQWVFKTLWDYVLLLEIAKREYPTQNSMHKFAAKYFQGQHERDARKLLEMSSGETSLTSRILQLISEVELSGEVAGASLSGKVRINNDSDNKGASLKLLNLVNSLTKSIACALKHEYYILIDDLDMYWADSPTHNSFIAALFTSLRKLRLSENLKPVVALRNNIYEALPLIDRDTFSDFICHVSWSYPAVKEMLVKRIVFKLQVNPQDVWGKVFPSDAFELVWRHSNGRPREAIRLITLAVENAVREGHLYVTAGDLTAAIRQFSQEKIQDIASEHQYKYPGLEFVIRKMSGWHKEFSFDRIKELVELISLEVELEEVGADRYDWVAGYVQNPIAFAKLLLAIGVLWIKASRTDDAQPYDPKCPMEITSTRWFAIHPMLCPGLSVVGA